MKYIDEFRDGLTAQGIADRIKAEACPGRHYRLMEFCGGHTHAIFRYGLPNLLPDNVEMVHGPGCPVCVLPVGRLDLAIQLVTEHKVTLCTYGDMLRVPASRKMSLLKARANGGDVRMVYSAADALALARKDPEREVVFFAIGFETTTPPTALVLKQASAEGLNNFSVLCNHVLTPPAIVHLVEAKEAVPIDGFVGPAHVSVVIGTQAYERFARDYHKPVVISGFEPLDVMQSILMLIRQLNAGRAEIENQYIRAVTPQGNLRAQDVVAETLELREAFDWRGLGAVPYSALRIRQDYARFDAEKKFNLVYRTVVENKACECPAILRGQKKPQECKLFGTVCTPETPIGSCMVSSEGACAATYAYGRSRLLETVT